MSIPITPSKTAAAVLISWQDIATANQVWSAAQSVPVAGGKRAVYLGVLLGRRSGSAFTAGWPQVRVQVSYSAGDNARWIDLTAYQVAVGASIANTTLNGAVSAGASTVVVTSATNIAAGDTLYLGDSSSANWELVEVKSVSGTTLTLVDATTYAHASGSAVTDQAERVQLAFGLEGVVRWRVGIDNAGSGQTVAAEVSVITYDAENLN